MKIFLFKVLIFVFVTLFNVVHSKYFFGDLQIYPGLLATIYFGLREGVMTGQLMGFCFGLMQDCFMFQNFNLNMLTHTLTGFMSGHIHNHVYVANFWILFSITFLSLLMHHIVVFFILTHVESVQANFYHYWLISFPKKILLNGFIVKIFFSIFQAMQDRFTCHTNM